MSSNKREQYPLGLAGIWWTIGYAFKISSFEPRLKIPHEVRYTPTLVKSLMLIAKARPFLEEYLAAPQELKLLRNAKVRAITYSHQLEGNGLGESEVTALLQGKRVAGLKKDIKEVQNYREALDYAE